jgi:hypothetical protein
MTHHETAERLFRQLRGEASRLRHGDSLEHVERELIAPSELTEELQSALWLYGWSLSSAAVAPLA